MTNTTKVSAKMTAAADTPLESASLAVMQADMTAALRDKQSASANTASTEAGNQAASLLADAKTVTDTASLDEVQLSRVIEMAWEDRTPFAAIEHNYGLNESAVIDLMRQQLKPSSFKLWRERVTNRATKHEAKRTFTVGRSYCKTQYKQR
ncbi:TIGR03643 family protein [Psychrobacter arenosus]